MTKWTIKEAVELATLVENIAPRFGAHVALTGGLLYKSGPRKDCDLLFYCIRQRDSMDREGLCSALEDEVDLRMGEARGWVRKAQWRGMVVDLFFPEDFPASSLECVSGTY